MVIELVFADRAGSPLPKSTLEFDESMPLPDVGDRACLDDRAYEVLARRFIYQREELDFVRIVLHCEEVASD